jgi:MFS family permease
MQKELRILLLSSALFMLAAGLFGPIYAVFVEEIGGDLLTAGTAYSAFAIAAGVIIFFISRWEDHVKHQEKLVILGYALSCVGFLGYLLIKKPLDLFIVQIILGIGEAVGIPAYDGLYSKHLDKGKFVSEWGLWESMNYIVLGISAALGGFLAKTYGFRFLFFIMFLLSVGGLIVSTFLVVRKKCRATEK